MSRQIIGPDRWWHREDGSNNPDHIYVRMEIDVPIPSHRSVVEFQDLLLALIERHLGGLSARVRFDPEQMPSEPGGLDPHGDEAISLGDADPPEGWGPSSEWVWPTRYGLPYSEIFRCHALVDLVEQVTLRRYVGDSMAEANRKAAWYIQQREAFASRS